MVKNDFQYGGWNSYTVQCGTIMTLISPGDPAIWHLALESRQWIHQVAAPRSVIRGSGMTCHWIHPVAAPCNVTCSFRIIALNSPAGSTLQCRRWLWDDMPSNSPKSPPYWNSTSGFTAVDMSFCTSLHQSAKFYPNRTTLGRKKWRHVDFQDGGSQPSWILGVQ